MAAKVVTTHPPTHSPAQQGEPTQSVFRRRNCDSLFPQGSSEAKKQQLQVEHLGFKVFTLRMIRVGLYCWGMIQHFTFMHLPESCAANARRSKTILRKEFFIPKKIWTFNWSPVEGPNFLLLDTFNKIERKNFPLEKAFTNKCFLTPSTGYFW